MEPPLITTVIPIHRRPQHLERAFSSVLGQTYPHLQVCVYFNASGVEMAEVVATYARGDARVKCRCHATNSGLGANFTSAPNDLKTSFFTMLSDDDCHLPRRLNTAAANSGRLPRVIIVVAAALGGGLPVPAPGDRADHHHDSGLRRRAGVRGAFPV